MRDGPGKKAFLVAILFPQDPVRMSGSKQRAGARIETSRKGNRKIAPLQRAPESKAALDMAEPEARWMAQ